jgi:hypothetical protein
MRAVNRYLVHRHREGQSIGKKWLKGINFGEAVGRSVRIREDNPEWETVLGDDLTGASPAYTEPPAVTI